MRAGEGLAAETGVELEGGWDHGLDYRGPFHVSELAPVQVAVGVDAFGPAQEDVAGGLHHPLALHDAFAGLAVAALREVVLQDGSGGSFDLQE